MKRKKSVIKTGVPHGGNYEKKVALMHDELIKKGKVVHLDITHEDSCTIFKTGICNCNPAMKVRESEPGDLDQKWALTEKGKIKARKGLKLISGEKR